ncbi:hypothetical protein ACFPJ7_18315, partial [Brachybacterium fresconis]
LVHRLVVLWNVDVLTTPITAGPRAVLRQRRDAPHHHEPGRAAEAGLRFIVGSSQAKAPDDLANHFHWNGDAFEDGQLIDTITPRHGNTKTETKRGRKEPVWGRRRIRGTGERYGPTPRSVRRETDTPSLRRRTEPARSSTVTQL